MPSTDLDETTFRRVRVEFELLLTSLDPEYLDGYRCGLRRAYHGDRFGTPEEHRRWLAATGYREARGQGYRHWLAVDREERLRKRVERTAHGAFERI